jgi:TonB family protein
VSSFYVPAESLLQSRAFRRLLTVSVVGHVLVYLALLLHPFWRKSDLISASPVMVQMVQLPKPAGAPKPPPAAKPIPPKPAPKPPEAAPPPPKPVVKEIVIPKEPAPLAKPKPVPQPVEKKPPPPSADELIQKMTERVEAKEAEQAAQSPTQQAPATAEASPGRFDPLFSPWIANVRARVRGNWSGASVCEGKALFDVDVGAGGQVSDVKLTQSSGDSYCDSTAERAIRKSNPLPPPPQAGTFELEMNPKDLQ